MLNGSDTSEHISGFLFALQIKQPCAVSFKILVFVTMSKECINYNIFISVHCKCSVELA